MLLNTISCLLLQENVVELGKISLDCLIIGEMDLGRVCHCLGMPQRISVLGCCRAAPHHALHAANIVGHRQI